LGWGLPQPKAEGSAFRFGVRFVFRFSTFVFDSAEGNVSQMPEGLELPEAEHTEYHYTLPVSISLSILAVLVAGATLLGHRAHTEELLLQSHATDQWAYYQAKNIRFHEAQSTADILASLAGTETRLPATDRQRIDTLRAKYLREAESYSGEKDDISEKAKEYESERDVLSRRADRFDAGEAFLEIGLVICSLTLLTKRIGFWFGGIFVGLIGVIVALTGLVLH
jgi:hypothetical protein